MWEGCISPLIGQKIRIPRFWLAVAGRESIPIFERLWLAIQPQLQDRPTNYARQCNVHTAVTFIVGSFPVHFELSKHNWIVNYVSSIHSYSLDSHRKKWIYNCCCLTFFWSDENVRRLRSAPGKCPVLQDSFWLVNEKWFCLLIGHPSHHQCLVFRSYIAELWARLIMINLILPKQVAFKLMTQNFYWTWLAGICAKIKLQNFLEDRYISLTN